MLENQGPLFFVFLLLFIMGKVFFFKGPELRHKDFQTQKLKDLNCHNLTWFFFSFTKSKRSVIPTACQGVQFSSHLKLRTACLLLLYWVHGRASPMVIQTGSRSQGSGLWGECQGKKEEQEFLARVATYEPWTPFILLSSGCTEAVQARSLSRMVVWKGKLWLLKDWVGQKPLC